MGKRVLWLLSMILVAATATRPQTTGGAGLSEKEITELMQKLERLDDPARMRLLSDVDGQRRELLSALLKQAGTASSPVVQAAAIFLIGRYRLSDGAAELARRIDFAPPVQRIPEPEPLWEKYPAMEALIAIGQPAIPQVIRLLAGDQNPLRRSLALKVLRYVDNDPDISRFRLKRAEAQEGDPGRKAMLGRALTEFESAFPNQ